MKKVYLFLLVLSSGIQISGMVQPSNNEAEVVIEGLDKRSAQAIFYSLEKLSNKFGKIYDPNASQAANSSLELIVPVTDLKEKTKNIPQLFAIVLNIEQAIEKNDGKAFWQEYADLKSLLRPIFRLPDNKKVKPEGWYEALKNYIFGKQNKVSPLDVPAVQKSSDSQGYIARAVGSVTGAVNGFCKWLFFGQDVQVE